MFSVFVLYQRNGSLDFFEYFRGILLFILHYAVKFSLLLTGQSAYNEIGGHVDIEGGSTGGHNNN